MIQLEKAERLLSIEASIANLYQKMMDSEKEKNIYYMYLERLRMTQKYESQLIQDLYSNLGLEKILKIFNLEEEKKPEELEFYSDFSISTRL